MERERLCYNPVSPDPVVPSVLLVLWVLLVPGMKGPIRDPRDLKDQTDQEQSAPDRGRDPDQSMIITTMSTIMMKM